VGREHTEYAEGSGAHSLHFPHAIPVK
jgi:hypothetical protein